MRHALLAALLGATVLAGCGGDDAADEGPKTPTGAVAGARAAAPTSTIRITDFVFDPSPATVRAGTRISVPNDDRAPHTLTEQPTSGAPAFDTGTLRGRQTGSFTARASGTYKIFCELHPFMKGEIEVVR
jgi:plastocyanin